MSTEQERTFTFDSEEQIRTRLFQTIQTLSQENRFNMNTNSFSGTMDRLLGLAKQEIPLKDLPRIVFNAIYGPAPTTESIIESMQFHTNLIYTALLFDDVIVKHVKQKSLHLLFQTLTPQRQSQEFTFDSTKEITERLEHVFAQAGNEALLPLRETCLLIAQEVGGKSYPQAGIYMMLTTLFEKINHEIPSMLFFCFLDELAPPFINDELVIKLEEVTLIAAMAVASMDQLNLTQNF